MGRRRGVNSGFCNEGPSSIALVSTEREFVEVGGVAGGVGGML